MAQPLKPAMHKMHEHGGAQRTASVATALGNAVGAGQPMVIGPAKATGPAHSQHAACSNSNGKNGSAAIAIAVRSGTIRHEHGW